MIASVPRVLQSTNVPKDYSESEQCTCTARQSIQLLADISWFVRQTFLRQWDSPRITSYFEREGGEGGGEDRRHVK
ncbi:13995_t:CDS:2, partial [Ambispora leptoticha]